MKNRLIGISIFFILGLLFVLVITIPEYSNKPYTAFYNIKGKGLIDDKNPNYWNKRKYVYFKMDKYYYIAKYNGKEKEVEDYITLYYLLKKEYKDYKYYLGTNEYLYLIGDYKIAVYNLDKKDKSINKFESKISFLGIDNDNIYLKQNNINYKYDKELKEYKEIETIPNSLKKERKIN